MQTEVTPRIGNSVDHSCNKANIKISYWETLLLIGSIALFVIGSLYLAGKINLEKGVIVPGRSLGVNLEGSFCIILGAIASAVIIGRMFSPRFRSFTNIKKLDDKAQSLK